MSTDILTKLSQSLQNIPGDAHLWLAYSGGMDSEVLLHGLWRLRAQHAFTLSAIHVHHGLHASADAWAAHCQARCTALQVPLTVKQVAAQPAAGQSPEDAARKARYAALADVIQSSCDYLLTAHHERDQAETLLLQLIRGAGPKGLSAMPYEQAFQQGFLLRPLLSCDYQSLQAYAREHDLLWIEDDSNQDLRYARNYLRLRVLPLLQQRWPSVTATIGRSAQLCAEADALLNEFAALDYAVVADQTNGTLNVARLLELSSARQRHVLRYWLAEQGALMPNQAQLAAMQTSLLTPRIDAKPEVYWGDWVVRRIQGVLLLRRA